MGHHVVHMHISVRWRRWSVSGIEQEYASNVSEIYVGSNFKQRCGDLLCQPCPDDARAYEKRFTDIQQT
jgi:hypothetical protein